jgi:hypothetical protein
MGHLLKIKCVDSRVKVHILASTSVPFTLMTVQVPNVALTHTKRITVCRGWVATGGLVIAGLLGKHGLGPQLGGRRGRGRQLTSFQAIYVGLLEGDDI